MRNEESSGPIENGYERYFGHLLQEACWADTVPETEPRNSTNVFAEHTSVKDPDESTTRVRET